MHQTAFTQFEADLLKECGCGDGGAPCAGMCTSTDCTATMMSQVSQACQSCLLNQATMGASSQCAMTAVLTDCSADPMCSAFSTCVICCVTQQTPC
jgi:hypothetical protein